MIHDLDTLLELIATVITLPNAKVIATKPNCCLRNTNQLLVTIIVPGQCAGGTKVMRPGREVGNPTKTVTLRRVLLEQKNAT